MAYSHIPCTVERACVCMSACSNCMCVCVQNQWEYFQCCIWPFYDEITIELHGSVWTVELAMNERTNERAEERKRNKQSMSYDSVLTAFQQLHAIAQQYMYQTDTITKQPTCTCTIKQSIGACVHVCESAIQTVLTNNKTNPIQVHAHGIFSCKWRRTSNLIHTLFHHQTVVD